MRKLLRLILLVPLAIILVALSVANRAPVSVTLDPLTPGNPALTLSLPLFAWLLLAMMAGALVGGAVVWFGQGRHRARARAEALRADAIAREAEGLKGEREAALKAVALPAPGA